MGTRIFRRTSALVVVIGLLLFAGLMALAQQDHANQSFEDTWAYNDRPVAEGEVSRTWMWGPEPISGALTESYQESPDGERVVQYYDKSRMEITSPDADPDSIWYVTNGLLVREMILGQVQIGHALFDAHTPAQINIAGDVNDPNAPTYATLEGVLDAPPREPGTVITQRLHRDGSVTSDSSMIQHGVLAAEVIQDIGIEHSIAEPFWDFVNSTGTVWENGEFVEGPIFPSPFYATGLPITEAYWTTVAVGGEVQDVLVQAFERRVLTYTPGNDPGWQVEAGNVGQHYLDWRYGGAEPEPPATVPPATEPEPDPSPTPSPTPTEPPPPPPPATDSDTYSVAFEFGGFGSDDGELISPQGMALAPGDVVYVADTGNDRIVKYADDGATYLFSWGTTGTGPGQFDGPTDVAVNSEGFVYVVDSGNHRVQVFDEEGDFLGQWGEFGTADGEFLEPHSIAIDIVDEVYVTDSQQHRVQQFTDTGTFILDWGSFGIGDFEFNAPTGITADRGSDVFVSDTGNDRITHYTSDGLNLLNDWDADRDRTVVLESPASVAVDNIGNVIVADSGNDRIVVFSRDGNLALDVWGGSDNFDGLADLVVSDDFELFVLDSSHHRVIRYEPRS